MKDNYDDFERLLGAKLGEINARLSVGDGKLAAGAAAGAPPSNS